MPHDDTYLWAWSLLFCIAAMFIGIEIFALIRVIASF
jgi:hypothetical protein